MLRSAESVHLRLSNRPKLFFQEFQPMWSQFTNVTDGRTETIMVENFDLFVGHQFSSSFWGESSQLCTQWVNQSALYTVTIPNANYGLLIQACCTWTPLRNGGTLAQAARGLSAIAGVLVKERTRKAFKSPLTHKNHNDSERRSWCKVVRLHSVDLYTLYLGNA